MVWIAANWESLGRFMRFALLQGFVQAMCAGAAFRAGARAPLAMLALLGTGALFAYFGQTYQKGACLAAHWRLASNPQARQRIRRNLCEQALIMLPAGLRAATRASAAA